MAKVKAKDGENLTSANIRKVIELLNPSKEGSKPITKKEACEILRISYNTSRLDKIIEEFIEKEQYNKKRRSQKSGTAATNDEICFAVQEYLQGEGITNIAKKLFRSAAFVKSVIERVGIPEKRTKKDRKGPSILPDACCAESFEPKEIVWSAEHDSIAEICHELSIDYQAEKEGFIDTNYEKKYGSKCYAIRVLQPLSQDADPWLSSSAGFYSYALAYDLGKLEHLKQYGIDLKKL